MDLNHPWWSLLLSLARELDGAGIPYSFDAATAMFVQGVPVPNMDDIDISVQWERLEEAHRLFSPYGPDPITLHPGWAIFRFRRDEVPVDILSYKSTSIVSDPDRVAVEAGGQLLYAKSLDFFLLALPKEHPRHQQITAFRSR